MRQKSWLPLAALVGSLGLAIGVASTASAQTRYVQNVATSGDVTPIGGTFGPFSFSSVSLNNLGQVAFGANNGSGDAIFLRNLSDGPGGAITKVVAIGDATPLGGTYNGFLGTGVSLTDSGHVVHYGTVSNSPSGTTFGVFRSDGLTLHAGLPQLRDGRFASNFTVGSLRSNRSGSRYGLIAGAPFATGVPTDALFTANQPSGVLTPLVQQFDAAPGGGTFSLLNFVGNPQINNTGTTLFSATFQAGGTGLFANQGGATSLLYRTGGTLLGSSIINLAQGSLAENGSILFRARVGTSADPNRLFLRNAGGVVSQIASVGDFLPGGGTIASLDGWAHGDSGLAFVASLSGGSSTSALYATGAGGLERVTGVGDFFQGSTIASLSLNPQDMNNGGQFVFNYTLADGRRGVAASSVAPEPASASLPLLPIGGLLVFTAMRRARRSRAGGRSASS